MGIEKYIKSTVISKSNYMNKVKKNNKINK